jgi:hypothetical protein
MKKMIVLLPLLFIVFVPAVSLSESEITKGLKDPDRLQIQHIKNELRHSIETLSGIEEDLRPICTAIGAHESKERFFLIRCRENIENIERIYAYLENELQGVLMTREDRISYYRYLKEYEVEQMKGLANSYLDSLRRDSAQISGKAALRLVDQATQTISSSSELIDKAIEIVQKHSEQKHGEHMHAET